MRFTNDVRAENRHKIMMILPMKDRCCGKGFWRVKTQGIEKTEDLVTEIIVSIKDVLGINKIMGNQDNEETE